MAFMIHVLTILLYTENGPAEGSMHQLKAVSERCTEFSCKEHFISLLLL